VITMPKSTGTGFTTVPCPKTPEHGNEYGFTVGGPVRTKHILNGRDKLFFYTTYDKFKDLFGVNFVPSTVPTALMRHGNFCELLTPANGGCGTSTAPGYKIYGPTTQTTCTAPNTGGAPCRYQYGYGPGVGVGENRNPTPDGQPINQIPASELSAIAQAMTSALPSKRGTSLDFWHILMPEAFLYEKVIRSA
jgi:hypothetical protein